MDYIKIRIYILISTLSLMFWGVGELFYHTKYLYVWLKSINLSDWTLATKVSSVHQ